MCNDAKFQKTNDVLTSGGKLTQFQYLQSTIEDDIMAIA